MARRPRRDTGTAYAAAAHLVNFDNVEERNLLAADIARRVRHYTWQPLPPELIPHLGTHAWVRRDTLGYSSYAALDIEWTPAPSRLTISFILPDGQRAARMLWTPEQNA